MPYIFTYVMVIVLWVSTISAAVSELLAKLFTCFTTCSAAGRARMQRSYRTSLEVDTPGKIYLPKSSSSLSNHTTNNHIQISLQQLKK